MRFYFPDSQDQIDPNFDWVEEEHPLHHVRQRDDLYAHEALREPASSGLLVSMGIERYTIAQRHRLRRLGVREFFRLDGVSGTRIETLGDCGAFSYVDDAEPPYTTDEVIEFYEAGDFDAGVSIDHVVTGFNKDHDQSFPGMDPVPKEWRRRHEITLELAAEFIKRHRERKSKFQPVGATQGWSPNSFAASVDELQKMGYTRIGLGGLVSLKTPDILRSLKAIDDVRKSSTEFHLFGVTRTEQVLEFKQYGVTSIDSTSPFRQAFKDDKDNYHGFDKNHVALRIPQVDGNASLKRLIRSGKVDQGEAIRLQDTCLERVRAFDRGEESIENVLEVLREYECLYDGRKDHTQPYRETLEARPWQSCPCSICQDAGVEVILFRGSERNKRRGFHNLWVFNQKLQRELGTESTPTSQSSTSVTAK